MQQEVSAFGVVAPSLMEESNVLMAERHSINNTLGEDKCLSRNVVEQAGATGLIWLELQVRGVEVFSWIDSFFYACCSGNPLR